MPRDDDDLGAMDLTQMLTGPTARTPGNPSDPRVARQPFADQMNGVYKGYPFGNAPGPLSPKDQAEIKTFAVEMTRALRNTALTAAQPAHAVPDLWSEPVDLQGSVTLQDAADPPGTWQTGIRFIVPPGRWARIEAYGVDVVDPAYTYNGSILWRILVNNSPVNSLASFGEHRGTLVHPRPTVIIAPQDAIVQFQLRRAVAAVAPQVVNMLLLGWIWRLRNTNEGTAASVTVF